MGKKGLQEILSIEKVVVDLETWALVNKVVTPADNIDRYSNTHKAK